MEEDIIKKFIQGINNKYHLKPGERAFSPIIQVSAYLGLEYISYFNIKEDQQLLPFFFSFPDKKFASVWLSICFLTNYFNEDYIENEGQVVTNLERNKKYSVYGSIGKYLGQITENEEKKFRFKFNDGEKFCKASIRRMIKDVNQSKKLNKVAHYSRCKKKEKQNRNPLSKILESSEGVIINDQIFTSKILLVTGRGNSSSVKNIFGSYKIFDKPLRKVYSPNDNIIIKPDLKEYRGFFDQNHQEKVKVFLKWMNNLINDPKVDKNILDFLQEIETSVAQGGIITFEIDAKFTDIVEEYSEIEPRLRKLINEYYPGVSSELPDGLRAVIINDINQIEKYPDTINGFLKNNIPVIFVSNRMIDKSTELTFYNRLFDPQSGRWKDAYRINWNRSKINALIEAVDRKDNFMDNELWEICYRYAKQTINIKISDEPGGINLDQGIRYFQQKINDLEGFENLKTAFFDYLYPVLYAFKNSNSIEVNNFVHVLIEEFKKKWENSKKYLQNNDFVLQMEDILKQLTSERFVNSKPLSSQYIFTQTVPIPDHGQLNIPVGSETNLPDKQNEKIIFTGFPFREFTGKYLQDACLKYFIPDITIYCWPHEGELTFNYLKKRIKSGYFLENLPDNTGVPDNLLLNQIQDTEDEIKEILQANNNIEAEETEQIDAENELIKLDDFQYEKYKSRENDLDQFKYSVKCNIVKLHDGSFLFLPYQSVVLSEFEDELEDIKIRNLKFNQLSSGLRIFKFASEQVDHTEMLKGNTKIDKANSTLEIWRKILFKLAKDFNSIEQLKQYLVSIANENELKDANPEIINLRRWLNDKEMISPSEGNLQAIIIAGKKKNLIQSNADELTGQILEAYEFIKRAHISLGHKVKSAIANQLKNTTNKSFSFKVKVQSMDIDIVAKKILELQESDIEVEYNNTRKFLC